GTRVAPTGVARDWHSRLRRAAAGRRHRTGGPPQRPQALARSAMRWVCVQLFGQLLHVTLLVAIRHPVTHTPTKPERRTMRIAIFGASGRTGRQLVEQAVAKGHQVTAMARHPDGLPSDLQGAVRLVKADVMDPDAIAPALADANTVVSALSGPG